MIRSHIQNANVLVVGDAMLDVYISANRSKPIPSETTDCSALIQDRQTITLGGAANVAANVSSLGASVTLATVTGDDHESKRMCDLCGAHNIDIVVFRDKHRETTTKTRIVAGGVYVARIDKENAHTIPVVLQDMLLSAVLPRIHAFDAVVFSDYDKGCITDAVAQEVISECRNRGVHTVVDAKPHTLDKYNGANTVILNAQEARALAGYATATPCVELYKRCGCDTAAVTLSHRGLQYYQGTTVEHIAGHRVDNQCAVGCGDTMRAAVAASVGAGYPTRDALVIGNAAAAVAVCHNGTARVRPEQVDAVLCV